MEQIRLVTLLFLSVLLTQCKAPTQVIQPEQPSLMEAQRTLDTTFAIFVRFAKQANGNPYEAIRGTAYWLSTQPNVASAISIDSTNIDIVLKSGIKTTFSCDLVDDNGVSLVRGGSPAVPTSHGNIWNSESHSKNTITNDSVLIFAAAYSEFGLSEQHMRSLFAQSKTKFNVTVLKDSECTYQAMQLFGNYGLVILDTHGWPESFLLGTKIDLISKPADEAAFKADIISQTSQDTYNKLLSGDLRFLADLRINALHGNWQDTVVMTRALELRATSQYIRSLPSMPNTVIFGNMCNSGWSAPSITIPAQAAGLTFPASPARTVTYDPIATAFTGRNLISYYGYAFPDGHSTKVDNGFAVQMEDSLVTELGTEYDSTEIAQRKQDGKTNYTDPNFGTDLVHFGAGNYSYGACGDPITDARDGQRYNTVCIGTQVWMAQNLNYAVSGSVTYNNDTANGRKYGRLYDWPTLMQGATSSAASPSGVQGVCPKGWHIPSLAEWNTLITFAGGTTVAGGPLKDTSALWIQPNVGASNSTGFTALPGGNANLPGPSFSAIGLAGYYWSSSVWMPSDQRPMMIQILGGGTNINSGADNTTKAGFLNSCRCVKDP